jgi:predicted Zn finger-like uncharacterized protein
MYTVCPRCTLTLAVTAEDLRTGQGYVRCGRCLNVFNALLALTEDQSLADQSAAAFAQAEPASSSQISRALEPVVSLTPVTLASDAPQADNPIDPVDPIDPSDPSDPIDPIDSADLDRALDPGDSRSESVDSVVADSAAARDSQPRLAESAHDEMPHDLPTEVSGDGAFENESSLAEGTGTFETIVLEGDAITQTEEFAPQESVDQEIAALTLRLQAASAAATESESIAAAAAAAESATATATAGATLEAEAEPRSDGLDVLGLSTRKVRASTPGQRRAWLIGGVLLGLVLIGQIVNHWRDALASQSSLSAPVTTLFSFFGARVDPRWDLNAYDIRQQGAIADSTDSQLIRLRLSVANHAARAQPAPMLRLTLLDRYGKRLAARDLLPTDYWPQGQAPRDFLGHDERIDSEIAVHDLGADSASFELDVCLRTLRGAVHCAGDAVQADAPKL